jgi:ring-1,2-phenylacetyl-CoA epoxidase subunit PaaB
VNEADPDPHAYEVFLQLGSGRPLQYVGSVRGGDSILAWQAAKEVYTRREGCTALWVVPRDSIERCGPDEEKLLAQGSARRYRTSALPSSRRRARVRKVENRPEDGS